MSAREDKILEAAAAILLLLPKKSLASIMAALDCDSRKRKES